MKIIINRLILIVLCFSVITAEAARKKKPRYKPYYLVSNEAAEFSAVIAATKANIEKSTFKIVGEYSPYENAHVIAITNDALLAAAGKSDFGGYGSVVRVSITAAGTNVQVSYVNPTYMSSIYQMDPSADISADLEALFGKSETFGSKKGLSKRALKGYQYMMFMPEFEDHDKLASFDSQKQALDTVNKNLASGKFKLNKVFEVAIPGKDEVLIGVGIAEGEGDDKTVMSLIDTADLKHTAHLPYAILVSEGKVYSQAGKFRIALAFPDLGMGQFMDISDAPDGIKDSLEQLTK